MPPDLAAKIAAMGRVVDPENTGKLYGPLQEKEPYAGVKVTRDVRYGKDERNVVDIFVPESGAAGRPVLMFVHGGGMIRGIKRAPGSPFYDNIMLFAAHHGMVGVNVEYRLAPQFPWPAGNEDLAAAVRLVVDKAADFGADPNRIYLMGHSAGATHVASYVSHPEFFGAKGSGLAGAILSSGGYDFTTGDQSEGRIAYFGSDPVLLAQRSAVAGLIKTKDSFYDFVGRTRPAANRSAVDASQGSTVQVRTWLCAQHRAPETQPHVEIVCDQYCRPSAFRSNS